MYISLLTDHMMVPTYPSLPGAFKGIDTSAWQPAITIKVIQSNKQDVN